MSLEGIDARGPELAKWRQPGVDLPQSLRFQPVQPALGVHTGFNESGLAQDPQVLGHGRLGHAQSALDLTNRLFGGNKEAENRPPVRLRNDLEDRRHPSDIPN